MKKMLFSGMLLCSLLVFSTVIARKDSSGIYKTASDFQQNKLSFAINYKKDKHKIKDDILFNDAEIIVKHDGETYKLDKNSTYAYKDTKGVVFRFVENKKYKVLSPVESLMIYAYSHPSNLTKGTIHYISDYYFSTDASYASQALTKENLKSAFPANHKFHDALDAQFKSDEDLYVYDSFHKEYKLNQVYDNHK